MGIQKATSLPAPSADRPTSTTGARDAELLAPAWHTAALIALMLAVALTGALLTSRGAQPLLRLSPSSRVTTVYLPMFVVQWGLALYVCRIGRPRTALRSLLGARWDSLGRAAGDLALAASGWLLLVAFEIVWAKTVGAGESTAASSVLPHTWLERLAWVVVSMSVGFCEEIVYRGYLQTQLTAFTGRATLGIVLQAALFGIAHGEQGLGAVVRLGLYGVAFGALARWRRSLLPGIVCHVWTDLASGFVFYFTAVAD
jgi:membrane protease YdiL (CAAX protease family)